MSSPDKPERGGSDLPVPRLTTRYLETLVVHEDYHNFPGTGMTVCCLVREGGYAVDGVAYCANLDVFDYEMGKRQARKKALSKLMDHEQYLLRVRLREVKCALEDPTDDSAK